MLNHTFHVQRVRGYTYVVVNVDGLAIPWLYVGCFIVGLLLGVFIHV